MLHPLAPLATLINVSQGLVNRDQSSFTPRLETPQVFVLHWLPGFSMRITAFQELACESWLRNAHSIRFLKLCCFLHLTSLLLLVFPEIIFQMNCLRTSPRPRVYFMGARIPNGTPTMVMLPVNGEQWLWCPHRSSLSFVQLFL